MRRTRRIHLPYLLFGQAFSSTIPRRRLISISSSRSPGGKREWPDHVSFLDSGTVDGAGFLQAVCQSLAHFCGRDCPHSGHFRRFKCIRFESCWKGPAEKSKHRNSKGMSGLWTPEN